MLESQMSDSGRRVVHATLWMSPDDGAALLAGVYHDPSVESLQALLSSEESKFEAERRRGDVTKINELARTKVGKFEVVTSDVERSNGGRGRCCYFLVKPNVVCLILIVQKGSQFTQYQEILENALTGLSIDTSALASEVIAERRPPPAEDDDGSSGVGFSDWERKVLPWVLFFVCSGICGGGAAKAKKK